MYASDFACQMFPRELFSYQRKTKLLLVKHYSKIFCKYFQFGQRTASFIKIFLVYERP